MIPNPSGEPAPRPQETTTFASASETPPVAACARSETRTSRSASESVGVKLSTVARRGRRFRGDRVRRDGQQRGGAVHVRLLEQAAAPADARHARGVACVRLDAVGREREIGLRGDVSEDLVAALASRCDHRGGRQPLDELDRGLGDGDRRVGAEDVVLGDVQRRDAVLAERRFEPL